MPKCPNCGSYDNEVAYTKENYNITKGVVGRAVVGPIGGLAGFEDRKSYKCRNCGCLFHEGMLGMELPGIKNANHYDVGLKDVKVKGEKYEYIVNGIYLTIKDSKTIKAHHCMPLMEAIEYTKEPALLRIHYVVKARIIRKEEYTDLTKEQLNTLVTAMNNSLEAFTKDKNHDLIMPSSIEDCKIKEIKNQADSYSSERNKGILIISIVVSILLGIYVWASTLDLSAFVMVSISSFILCMIELRFF